MLDALQNYGVRSPMTILPTGLEANQLHPGGGARFRNRHGIEADRPTLLYVGRIAHEKNIDFLLHCFKRIHVAVPEALFIITGEGPAREHLQTLTHKLQLDAAVKFIGYLQRDTELLDCYRAGDLFVFASRTETQGLVLLEALAQGTPVVSTMHMGTRDVLHNTRGTRIVSEDEQAFAQACIDLLKDAATRKQLAERAPHDAARWSSREMTGRLVNLYTEVMTRPLNP
jgi:1,2-diacylglycerol 3-alpha-glucosyltransferase